MIRFVHQGFSGTQLATNARLVILHVLLAPARLKINVSLVLLDHSTLHLKIYARLRVLKVIIATQQQTAANNVLCLVLLAAT